MALIPLIFSRDPMQALRIKRLLFAVVSYLFGGILIAFAQRQGLAPGLNIHLVLATGLALNIGFYALIRSGANRRLRDPGLTIPQMAVGTLAVTYMIFHAHEARGAFVLGYVLVLLFGIFRLRARPTLLIGAIAVLSYAAVVIHEALEGATAQHLAVEILQLMVLAFIYPFFAQLGSHLNETRAQLRRANTHLEQTLADYERALELIRIQATHDDLTGVYNRRHMMAVMDTEEARLKRGGLPFSILMLDIDHFKRINDHYGHPGGDRVLVFFAEVVRKQLRAIDQFGRFGGEEFLVVLPQTHTEQARAVAERIREAVAAAPFPGIEHPVTVSIGVACAEAGETQDRVFTRADRALYLAKKNGRNRIEAQLLTGR